MQLSLEIVAAICADLNGTGHMHSPRVEPALGFDLTSFKRHPCDIPNVDHCWVKQSGPGMYGDDFQSVVAYPIGDSLFIAHCDT